MPILERIEFYPIVFIVRHPIYPIVIDTVLPAHIKKVIGIKAVHSVGIEQMTTEQSIPLIGHLSLEFNSKKYHFGNIDVAFNNSKAAHNGYLETDITIQQNTAFMGNYENKVFKDSSYVNPDLSTTSKWNNYIATIYLKSICND